MMISIFMVDGQQLQVFPLKFTATFGADPAVDLKRLFAVVGIGGFIVTLEASHQLAELLCRGQFLCLRAENPLRLFLHYACRIERVS